MSGPLEELRAAASATDEAQAAFLAVEGRGVRTKADVGLVSEALDAARSAESAATRALLAASGTGERPADEPHGQRCYARDDSSVSRCWFAPLGLPVPTRRPTQSLAPTPPAAGTGTPSDDGRHRSITAIQDAISAHAEKAWPTLTVEVEGLALMEEALELFEVLAKHLAAIARSLAKRHHGNRGTADDWTAELRKEMADTVLVLCNLAHLEHFDLGLVVNERLDVVLARSIDHDPVAAAPSGTTGATTGDEAVCVECSASKDSHLLGMTGHRWSPALQGATVERWPSGWSDDGTGHRAPTPPASGTTGATTGCSYRPGDGRICSSCTPAKPGTGCLRFADWCANEGSLTPAAGATTGEVIDGRLHEARADGTCSGCNEVFGEFLDGWEARHAASPPPPASGTTDRGKG